MLNNTKILHNVSQVMIPPLAPWADELQYLHPRFTLSKRFQQYGKDPSPEAWHSLHRTENLWAQSMLPVFNLRWLGDNIDMVHQVESRPAFLDYRLTEYVNQIPPSLKLKYDPDTSSFNEKFVLREAARPFITDEIYRRKKHPFVGPIKWNAGGPLHRLFQDLVTNDNENSLGFVSWEKAEQLLRYAFEDQNPSAFRSAMVIAQFVVLMQTFGVKSAKS